MFAIAATLLILDVHTDSGRLGHQLLHIWPSYAGYAISFITIGIMWINHLTVLDQLDRVNRTFLMLSVLFLMLVAFVPFPTRLVAEHIRDDGARAATVAYGVTLTLTALLYNSTWLYASRNGRLIRADADPQMVSGITRSFLPGTFIYATATIVSAISPIAGVILYGTIAAFYVVESSIFGSAA